MQRNANDADENDEDAPKVIVTMEKVHEKPHGWMAHREAPRARTSDATRVFVCLLFLHSKRRQGFRDATRVLVPGRVHGHEMRARDARCG